MNFLARSSDAEQESESEATRVEPPATKEAVTRICKKPGCTTPLASTNRSGRCSSHFHWKGTTHGNTGKAHGSARSNGTNGHGLTLPDEVRLRIGDECNKTERSIEARVPDFAGEFVEARLNQLILSLSIADKAKIATAWLKGIGIFEA
jgi:hypothetical protein